MSDNPYNAPQVDVEVKSVAQKSIIGRVLAIVGVLLLYALPIGLISTIYEISQVFEFISLYGNGDPKIMKEGISQALVPTVLGLLFGIWGVPILCVAIWGCRYRRPWLYHVIKIYALFMLLVFPVGTVIGIVTLLVLRHGKARYFN